METSRSLKQNIQRELLFRLIPRKSDRGGFTLIELLVSMIVTSIIVSGMLYVVVEVLGINQKDASRNDTQRDIQMAMDYITRDLREAMYVYGVEEELVAPADPANTSRTLVSCLSNSLPSPDVRGATDKCTGLLPYLPDSLNKNDASGKNIPVLAFWKPEPLPASVTSYCKTNSANIGKLEGDPIDRIPCVSQRMYTLVVYSLNTENPNNIWRGRSRIVRYTLPHFLESSVNGAKNTGWVAPVASDDKRPLSWPFGKASGGTVNLQAVRATGDSVVLTDFVNNDAEVALPLSTPFDPVNPSNIPKSGFCPAGFEAPNFGRFTPSFYACVRRGAAMNENPEVRVVIKGNAAGRGGIPKATGEVPFQMESHVIGRSAYGKQRSGG